MNDRLRIAFSLVDPQEYTFWAHGAEIAAHVTWRDEISALVPSSRLAHYGVTIEDVIKAVEHYTATTPIVTQERIGAIGARDFRGERGWLVKSAGYRKGPAGP